MLAQKSHRRNPKGQAGSGRTLAAAMWRRPANMHKNSGACTTRPPTLLIGFTSYFFQISASLVRYSEVADSLPTCGTANIDVQICQET